MVCTTDVAGIQTTLNCSFGKQRNGNLLKTARVPFGRLAVKCGTKLWIQSNVWYCPTFHMVGRSGSVTDVAGSFPHHLQDICDTNGKVGLLKVCPSWVCNCEAKISTAASMRTGQIWEMVHFKALNQLLNRELKWGHCE